MFLASLALRTCAFLALYRRTLVGTRVYESRMAPFDALVAGEPKPFLSIYVDEVVRDGKGGLMGGAAGTLTLVVEAALGQAVTYQVAGEGEAGEKTVRSVIIPDTDPALEWSLDLLGYQVARVLDVADGWADLFRRFRGGGLAGVSAVRGVLAEHGARAAVRQIVLDIMPLGEPMPDVLDDGPDASPWVDFLAALRSIPDDPVLGPDPEMATYPLLADAIEDAIRAPIGGSWRQTMVGLGVAVETAAALGITPHPLVMPDAEAALVAAVSVPGDTIDADRAAAAGGVPDAP